MLFSHIIIHMLYEKTKTAYFYKNMYCKTHAKKSRTGMCEADDICSCKAAEGHQLLFTVCNHTTPLKKTKKALLYTTCIPMVISKFFPVFYGTYRLTISWCIIRHHTGCIANPVHVEVDPFLTMVSPFHLDSAWLYGHS